jgi:hypothetical protein
MTRKAKPSKATARQSKAEKATRRYVAKLRMAFSPELGAEICWRMETRDPDSGQVRSLSDICR